MSQVPQSFPKFIVGFATDIGQKRTQNQDSVTVHPELGLFVVADGMGGHKGGEIASSMAVEIIPRLVKEAQAQSPDWNPKTVLTQAIAKASNAIFARSAEDLKLRGMGTTTVSMLFKNDRLYIGHVGDSRCYYLLPGAIWQATRDHSLVQEKLRAGMITRNEVKTDKMRNVITRSVGFEYDIQVEIYEFAIHPGDTFLLCSDGLSGLVEDPEILQVVQKTLFEENDITRAVQQLIGAANQNGGDDNITTVLVQICEDPPFPSIPEVADQK